jgi:putative tricarboxylic transport membrane protein
VRVSIRNPKDFWAGVIFVAVGLAAVGLIRSHPMGSAMRMGPAYFPTVLGGLAILIGLATMLRGCARPGPAIGTLALGKVAFVVAAVVGFGVLLRPLGLAGAIVQLVLLSAYASRYFRWPIALALSVGLAAGSSLVFARLLRLPIPMLGTWFGG